MHLTAELETDLSAAKLFPWVAELERYPRWLGIVRSVEPAAGQPGADPSWEVVLEGRLGPFRRAKRLRMRRVELDPARRVRFERHEEDGRDHAPWELEARLAPVDAGSHLVMELRYGGRLWAPSLDRLLRSEIDAARERLVSVAGGRLLAR